jgi:hypothetical protein
MTKLLTNQFSIEAAKQFKESIKDKQHYVFAAKITPHVINEDTPDTVLQKNDYPEIFDEMSFGKKIAESDVSFLVKKNLWVSGTVYNQYKTNNTTNFYATILSGSFYRTYLCLENNRGGQSTSQPSGTDTLPFQTVDGYTWKYMFSVHVDVYNKFATSKFIPVQEDSTVKISAIPGSISSFEIQEVGGGYVNYFTSSFRTADLRFGGDPAVYRLQESASSIIDFYNGCIIKMTSGDAAGEYRRILDFYISGSDRLIQLESAFSTDPLAGDTYEITPAIQFSSNGKETTQAIARAIINPVNGSLQKIEILNYGKGYDLVTASVYTSSASLPTSAAIIVPMVSPKLGHGSDVFKELNAIFMGVSVSISGAEANNVSTDNKYRMVGVIKEPKFKNISLVLDPTRIGSYTDGEELYFYKKLELTGTVTVNTNSKNVTGSSTKFSDAITNTSIILISDGVKNLLGKANTVSNNTFFTLESNSSWSNSNCKISILDVKERATIVSSSANSIIIDTTEKISGQYSSIIGSVSAATANVNYANNTTLTIDGRTINSFDTFNQLTYYEGTFTGTPFVENEPVLSGNNTALIHSVNDTLSSDRIYVVKEKGTFANSSVVTGNPGSGSFTVSNKYNGFVERGSGEILYIETVPPIERDSNRSETIRIVLEF